MAAKKRTKKVAARGTFRVEIHPGEDGGVATFDTNNGARQVRVTNRKGAWITVSVDLNGDFEVMCSDSVAVLPQVSNVLALRILGPAMR